MKEKTNHIFELASLGGIHSRGRRYFLSPSIKGALMADGNVLISVGIQDLHEYVKILRSYEFSPESVKRKLR